MMLLHLQAMDNVQALSLVEALPNSLTTVAQLFRPTVLLTVLATIVILSSIRAAVLFLRPPSTDQSGKVSVLQDAVRVSSSEGMGEVLAGKSRPSSPTPTAPPTDSQPKPMSSWLWGLVKWERLPALPVNVKQTAPMSQTERGWQEASASLIQRRPTPPFRTAVYQSDVPVSMAKMIMSRHTFRRPASRPPPARPANVPQYQRRTPSMV